MNNEEKELFIQSLLDSGWTRKAAEKAYEDFKNPKQSDNLDLGLGFSGVHPETFTYRQSYRGGCSG